MWYSLVQQETKLEKICGCKMVEHVIDFEQVAACPKEGNIVSIGTYTYY